MTRTRYEDIAVLDRDADSGGQLVKNEEQVMQAAVGVADGAARQRWDTDGGGAGR